ncbi:hypothetical protein OOT46_18215 [Aquabacterium sp. A7-Y]|uniref:hypothetical protein n=1 Tax=Aquabacterium sp. A7-Y TaxID=1349605 RepID=UPI00223CD209|nr:hypothetical protein [Aquabacterium sp. A7-Y]MCW7539773.1 hypothetical protein [Aquabacterium sp. A7-Y]
MELDQNQTQNQTSVRAVLAAMGGASALRRRPPAVRYENLDAELTAVNAELEARDLGFSVDSKERLQQAKKAAGLGNTTDTAHDFKAFVDRLVSALRLGAFDGVAVDAVEQQAYADKFRAEVRKLVAGRLEEDESFTFAQCKAFAEAVTEEAIHGLSAAALARKVVSHLGGGQLAGLFPGEKEEATAEQGGKDRLSKMKNLGTKIVDRLSKLPDVGDLKPEVTGSIVLTSGDYAGIPEDLDINVRTTGSDEERGRQWQAVVGHMNRYNEERLAVDGGTVRIFAMKAGKLQGDNDAIWTRRYGYELQDGDAKGKVMPFEIEVKDVGSTVWSKHLADTAQPRNTDENGSSLPQWLLIDTMTRILQLRQDMAVKMHLPDPDHLEGVPANQQAARWIEVVKNEGVKMSAEKRLWEKMKVAASLAAGNVELQKWILQTVKEPERYLELLKTVANEDAYQQWLTSIESSR